MILTSPSPQCVALATRVKVVGQDWSGIDGVNLLKRLVSGSANSVTATEEPRLTDTLDNLWKEGGREKRREGERRREGK